LVVSRSAFGFGFGICGSGLLALGFCCLLSASSFFFSGHRIVFIAPYLATALEPWEEFPGEKALQLWGERVRVSTADGNHPSGQVRSMGAFLDAGLTCTSGILPMFASRVPGLTSRQPKGRWREAAWNQGIGGMRLAGA
jgi:hypothetical protein